MAAIQLSDDQFARIEGLAHERGYGSIAEYLFALVDADAVDLEAEFREAWHDAMTGNTMPALEALMNIRIDLGVDDNES